MSFKEIIASQSTETEFAWLLCRTHPRKIDLRQGAVTRTIALAHTLQQLGYLDEAEAWFRRLLGAVGLSRQRLESLYDVIGEELGDHAMVVFFRQNRADLGSDECGRSLRTAVDTLRLKANKAKFLWRLEGHKILARQRFDCPSFEGRYIDLIGEAWATASGNPLGVRKIAALARAGAAGRVEAARHWGEAESIATKIHETVMRNLFFNKTSHNHLATHTVLCSLGQVVDIRRAVEHRRGRRNRVRDLEAILDDIVELRRDAGVRADAEGHRENAQTYRALFGEVGLAPSSAAGRRAERKAEHYEGSHQDRLRSLCRRVEAL